MEKMNGNEQPLDLEHELPAATQPEQAADAAPAGAPDSAVQTELQKVKEERDSLVDRMARMQAEFENARRRNQREQQEYREFALTEAIKLLLPILDSFDRALASGAADEDFRSGMQLIDRQLHDILGKLGVSEIEAEGQPFDPNLHEAIEMVETDQAEDNHVFQELQRGYRLKGRLLRPAMVRVARNSK